jgi:hypothetical protein
MSNKIKGMFLLFIIISLSGCAGIQWKDTNGAVASDSVVVACGKQCGSGGVEGPGNPWNAPGFGTCRTACMKSKGYSAQ